MRSLPVALILLVLALSGASLAQTREPPTPVDKSSELQKEVAVDPRASDAGIASRLQRIFLASGWVADPQVVVREGIVFIDGATETSQRRDWAADIARNTEEVVAVVNRLEVEPSLRWNLDPLWSEARNLAIQAQQMLPLILLALFILAFAIAVAKGVAVLARWALREKITSNLLLTVVSRTLALPVLLVGIYLVLQVSGLTRLALTVLGGTGILGIVLGFAFRDIVENFLASLLLSIRNPFARDDMITVAGHTGIVRNMNSRTTVLLTLDGNHIQIPNSLVFKNVIVNYSSNDGSRADFIVGIGYDDPISLAQSTIKDVLSKHAAVIDQYEPLVLVDELAASTVNLRVYFWFDSKQHSKMKLQSALMRQIKHALNAANISMPDEAREVIFPQGVPLLCAELSRSRESHVQLREDRTVATETIATLPSAPPIKKVNDANEADAVSDSEGQLVNEAITAQKSVGHAQTRDEQEELLK